MDLVADLLIGSARARNLIIDAMDRANQDPSRCERIGHQLRGL